MKTPAPESSEVNNALMRAVRWFLGLFACAVALALLMGGNLGTVTLFWPPWRVDVSANLALLLLLAAALLLHAGRLALRKAWRPAAALARFARFGRRAPARPPEACLAEAWAHRLAGRTAQARQAAAAALAAAGAQDWALQAQAHLMAAACETGPARQRHWRQAQAALTQLEPLAPSTAEPAASADGAADTVPAGRRVLAASGQAAIRQEPGGGQEPARTPQKTGENIKGQNTDLRNIQL